MNRQAILAAIAAVVVVAPVHAQTVNPTSILSDSCVGIRLPAAQAPLPVDRIAQQVLAAFGVSASDIIADMVTQKITVTPESYRDALLARINDQADKNYISYLGAMADLQMQLRTTGGPAVVTNADAVKGQENWLFDAKSPAKLVCNKGQGLMTAEQKLAEEVNGRNAPKFGLTKDIASLGLAGGERLAAKSATIGFTNTVVRQDDGTNKRTQAVTIDATLGVRLTKDGFQAPLFAFASYTLNRSRARPAAALLAGQFSDDGDINVLETGLTLQNYALSGSGPTLSVAGSYIVDFVSDAQRLRLRSTLTPGFKGIDLQVCGLGYLKALPWLGNARARCFVNGEGDFGHVLKAPRQIVNATTPLDILRGDFLSLGFSAGIETAPPLWQQEGFVASVGYRYLWTVSGTAPDIDRLEASLKYRWWLNGGAALDFGGSWKHGDEPKSYQVEDLVELTFGILF